MEAEDPLAQLADIHLPATVSFWPPAPGWWILAAIIIAALVLAVRYLASRWRRAKRLALVLAELSSALHTFDQDAADPNKRNAAGLALLYAVNSMLKRVALLHYPNTDVASLSGTAWLSFLDKTGDTDAFTQGAGCVLADGSYRPSFHADSEALYKLAHMWISKQYQPQRAGKNRINSNAGVNA